MRHLLMDPAFPDLVGEAALEDLSELNPGSCANDNLELTESELCDPLLTTLARMDVEATRLW